MGCLSQREVIVGFYHKYGYRIESISDQQWREACNLFNDIVDPDAHGYGVAYHMAIAQVLGLDLDNLPSVNYAI
jgi:hypothetical protein